MKETSFGSMESFKFGSFFGEYLEFYKSGRPHTHEVNESFKVLSGSGWLYINGERVEISQGGVYEIPPHTEHYMRPVDGKPLKLIVTYAL